MTALGDAAVDPFRVLMVCTANRIRSAMAEFLLRARLASLPLPCPIEVGGAGTLTVDGEPMMPLAVEQLVRRGVDPSGFASRALTERIVGGADLVLTATRAHRSRVLEDAPLALKRTFTLREFAALVSVAGAGGVAAAGVGGVAPGGAGGAGMTAPGSDPAGASAGRAALQALVRAAAANRSSVPLGDDGFDIGDPAGGPVEGYEVAATLIDQATATIATALAHARG